MTKIEIESEWFLYFVFLSFVFEFSRGSSRGGVFINAFDIMRIFSYSDYYGPPRDPEELSFIESVFSFMFGDGNPNKDLEDYRWNIIGRYIKVHVFQGFIKTSILT